MSFLLSLTFFSSTKSEKRVNRFVLNAGIGGGWGGEGRRWHNVYTIYM
jgi:hypothetical protein